jgi:hypothetical protein
MNLLYYPKELVDKAVHDLEIDDYESDLDLYDEDSHPSEFLHLFDKNVKNYLKFSVILSCLPTQKFMITCDGNDEMLDLSEIIAEKLQFKLDFLQGINDMVIK